jgi:hypothetical protein
MGTFLSNYVNISFFVSLRVMGVPIFMKFPNIETHNSQSHLMNIPQNLGPNDNYIVL